MESITGPDQPALLADLNELVLELPELGKRIEDRLTGSRDLASEAPKLPEAPESFIFDGFEIGTKAQNAEVAKVAGTVNFDLDDIELDDTAKAQLNELAAWLEDNPAETIGIFGHTDLTGPETYNDDLGQSRADRVAAYLMTLGISRERMGIVMSFGETSPMVKTEEQSRENRRVKVQTIRRL